MYDKKTDFLTFVSVISCIFVLYQHSFYCFWTYEKYCYNWCKYNIIVSIFYSAIPMFYMVSSAKFINFYDKYTLKVFLYKRIFKTVIYLVFWNLIAIICAVIMGKVPLNNISIKYVYDVVVNSKLVFPYWFLNSIIIYYLCMPLFASVDKNKRDLVFLYLLIVGILLNVIIPFFDSLLNLNLHWIYNLPVVENALIWIPLGYFLAYKSFSNKSTLLIYSISLIAFLCHIIGTNILKLSVFDWNGGGLLNTQNGYENLLSIIYSSGMFLLLKNTGIKVMISSASIFFKTIGQYTLPIYLMHIFVYTFFRDVIKINIYSPFYKLLLPVLTVPIIIFITYFIRKIRFLKYFF